MRSNGAASLRGALLAAALTALVAPAAAQTALYKWVDERGVVNYGDAPPKDARKLTQLDEAQVNLSLVPGLPKETLDDLHEREMRARVERLEHELQELRERESRRAAVPVAPDGPQVAALQDYVAQPLVVVRRFPPHRTRLPVHARPLKRPPPTPSMRLEQRP